MILDPIDYIIELKNPNITYLLLVKRTFPSGHSGWYSLLPHVGVVGYWDKFKDDLSNVNIGDWNKKAEEAFIKYNRLKAFI